MSTTGGPSSGKKEKKIVKSSVSPGEAAAGLKFFLSSIRNTQNPAHCAVCLSGAFSRCTESEKTLFQLGAPGNAATKSALKCKPELWDGLLAFLLTERTDKQMERLLTRLSICRCNNDRDHPGYAQLLSYHEIGQFETTGYYCRMDLDGGTSSGAGASRTYTTACCAFYLILINALTLPLLDASVRSASKGSATFWPVRLTDIMPFGPDNLVKSLQQLYRFVPDSIIARAMTLILKVTQSLSAPSFIKYRFADNTFHHFMRRMVDRMILNISLQQPIPSRATLYRFYLHLTEIIGAFHILDDDIPYDLKAALFRGCEVKATQLCSMLLYLAQELKPHMETAQLQVNNWTNLAFMGREIFALVHAHMPQGTSIPVHPLFYEINAQDIPLHLSQKPPLEAALSIIRTFHNDLRCSAEGCLNSMRQVGNSFRRCNACVIAPYCSQECQQKAWKDQCYPHKRLCSILRRLVDLGGGDVLFFAGDKPDLFDETILANWRNSTLDEGELAMLKTWALSIERSRGYLKADDLRWNPGFEDYEDIIAKLSVDGRGPKPMYLYPLNMLT